MTIGIITFNWPTNYGAVMQCYALQTVLENEGHIVSVINYKPKHFDGGIYSFLRNRNFLHLKSYFRERNKKNYFDSFRAKYLYETQRYYSEYELHTLKNYDAFVTGSDQVLNPSFLQYGEKGGSTAYFLGFVDSTKKRFAYAVSFGVSAYPKHLQDRIRSLISQFDRMSVREKSGLDILSKLGRKDAIIVPDPTLLLNGKFYFHLATDYSNESYVVTYILKEREKYVSQFHDYFKNISFVDCNGGSIENWLGRILHAKFVITNSFHGLVFSLLFHKPFIVLLPAFNREGQNDRFYTLLEKCHLEDRIVIESNPQFEILNKQIDWDEVDKRLEELKKVGYEYIHSFVE